MAIIKSRIVDDLFLCSFIVCSKKKKKKKEHEKNEKKKLRMVPILSHVNPTFSQVGLQIGSYAFNTLIFAPLKKKEKKKRRVQFASNGSLGLWTLNRQ